MKNVRMLTRNELNFISENLMFSKHSLERLAQRSNYSIKEIRNKVRKSYLGYFNTDGSINIAFSDYECLVITPYWNCNKFKVITYKEATNITMSQKYLLALQGIEYHYRG